MALPVIGSVFQSIRMMGLSMKWQQRNANPTMPKAGEDPQVAMLRKQASDVRKSNAIASIQSKLDSGAELTPEELEYLRNNCPALYEEAMQIKRERTQYKQQLANCRTKEEVEQLYINKMQGYLAASRAISNNPSLSKGEKLGQLERIARRMMAIQSEQAAFVRRGDYERLPREKEITDEQRADAAEKSGELSGAEKSGQDGEHADAPDAAGVPGQETDASESPDSGKKPDTALGAGQSAHEVEQALYKDLGIGRPGAGTCVYDSKGVVRELDFKVKRTPKKRL